MPFSEYRFFRVCSVVLALWLLSVGTFGQTLQRNRQLLEREKKQNLERMSQIRTILNKTASEKQVSLGQLKALNQQIQAQSKQINLMTEDLKLMDNEIVDLRKTSDALTKDLNRLKQEYADMIYMAERRRQQLNPLGFLFGSDNFNQLVARYRYLKQYSNARQSQVKQIQTVQSQIQEKRSAAERKRNQQKVTLVAKVDESKKLEGLKEEQNKVVKELGTKETLLREELAESRRAVANVERMIRRIIEREARERAEREARERAERERLARLEAARKAAERKAAEEAAAAAAAKAAKANENTEGTVAETKPAERPKPAEPAPEPEREVARKPDERRANNLNDEEFALASSFAASRSRLPWPVSHGFISDQFGRKPHPVLKGVMVENLGIDIQTNNGETVRSVYDGIVRDVEYMPGMNTVVAIQHGDYMTVYAKLRNSNVRPGQRVKARESIGVVATDKDGVSEVQFQIWKNTSRLNPASWLLPR